MDMQPVTSSQVAEIGHDPETRTMHVRFVRGGLYEYDNVSPELHQTIINSPSIGANIRKHVAGLAYRKLG